MPQELRLALRWWLIALGDELAQSRDWRSDATGSVVHLFCDAAGRPPMVAAVLFIDGECYWTSMPPAARNGEARPGQSPALRDRALARTLRAFQPREDNQIMGLEMLSIALGLCSFESAIRRRWVVFWSDNTGAQAAAGRGAARAFDHGCLAHCLWTKIARLRCLARVERVPTDENIADDPSRGELGLLQQLGAARVEPRLDEAFCVPASWESMPFPCTSAA